VELDLGEKVWAGNENCQSELVNECSVEAYSEPIAMPTVSYQDGEMISYEEPVVSSEEVTAFSSHCRPSSQQTFQIPYQTFDHRLKCLARAQISGRQTPGLTRGSPPFI
jgi:hypothetical protein